MQHSSKDPGKDRRDKERNDDEGRISSLQDWDEMVTRAGLEPHDEEEVTGREQAGADDVGMTYEAMSRSRIVPASPGEEGFHGVESGEPSGSLESEGSQEDPYVVEEQSRMADASGVGEAKGFDGVEDRATPDVILDSEHTGEPDDDEEAPLRDIVLGSEPAGEPEIAEHGEGLAGNTDKNEGTDDPSHDQAPDVKQPTADERAFQDAERDAADEESEDILDIEERFYDGGLDPEHEIEALFQEGAMGHGPEPDEEDFESRLGYTTYYDEHGFPVASDNTPWSSIRGSLSSPGDAEPEKPLDFDDRDRRGPSR